MSTLHPHWHETEENGDAPVSIHVKNTEDTEPAAKAVSRTPAAMVGTALALFVGSSIVYGTYALRGQLASAVDVRITESGLVPADISVENGQEITWINEQQIPHYLLSSEMCTPNGDCLNTETIFNSESTSYTVPTDIADGSYEYFSASDTTIKGTITIGGSSATIEPPAIPNPDPSTDPGPGPGPSVNADTTSQESSAPSEEEMDPETKAQQAFLDRIARQLEENKKKQSSSSSAAQSFEQILASTSNPNIPQNPNTISNQQNAPRQQLPSPQQNAQKPPVQKLSPQEQLQQFQNIPAPMQKKPFKQPTTGPGIVAVIVLSIGALWMVVRKVRVAVAS